MKRYLFLFYCILLVFSLFALNDGQRLVPAGHWVYESLWKLSLETGEVPLLNTAPLSRAEIDRYMAALDTARLSAAGMQERERVLDFLNKGTLSYNPSPFTVGIDPSLHIESYYKSSTEIPWVYDNKEKKHLLDLPIIISLENYLTAESNFFLANNYWTMLEADNVLNIPLGNMDSDIHFPDFAYISFGLPFAGNFSFNAQLGKGALSLGKTQLGNIILNDSFYHDAYAVFSLYSPRFRYAAYTLQAEVNKYLYMHKMDFNFKRFQFSILEGAMVAAPLELRFLNPVMIFHNYAAWRSYADYDEDVDDDEKIKSRVGSYFAASFDYTPWKNMRLYGILAFNQFQLPFERKNFGDAAASIPDSLGFQGGFETSLPYKAGYFIGGIEGVYTSPWFYFTESKESSFYSKRLDLIKNTSKNINSWVGFPFGPDTIAGNFYFGYEKGGDWSAKVSYRFLAQGEMSGEKGFAIFENPGFYPSNPKEALITSPSGIAQFSHTIGIGGLYKPLSYLEISSQLAYTFIINKNNIKNNNGSGVELVLSTSFLLP